MGGVNVASQMPWRMMSLRTTQFYKPNSSYVPPQVYPETTETRRCVAAVKKKVVILFVVNVIEIY